MPRLIDFMKRFFIASVNLGINRGGWKCFMSSRLCGWMDRICMKGVSPLPLLFAARQRHTTCLRIHQPLPGIWCRRRRRLRIIQSTISDQTCLYLLVALSATFVFISIRMVLCNCIILLLCRLCSAADRPANRFQKPIRPVHLSSSTNIINWSLSLIVWMVTTGEYHALLRNIINWMLIEE